MLPFTRPNQRHAPRVPLLIAMGLCTLVAIAGGVLLAHTDLAPTALLLSVHESLGPGPHYVPTTTAQGSQSKQPPVSSSQARSNQGDCFSWQTDSTWACLASTTPTATSTASKAHQQTTPKTPGVTSAGSQGKSTATATPTPKPSSSSTAPVPTARCVVQPTAVNCTNRDPIAQGCVTDAHTTASAEIKENGQTIGRLERRHSPTCQTYWARVFDLRAQKRPIVILIKGVLPQVDCPSSLPCTADANLTGPSSNAYNYAAADTEAYSNMVFVPSPLTLIPEVSGALALSSNDLQHKTTNGLTAALPAVLARTEP